MSDRDYIAWSLLVAGGYAVVLAIATRFRAKALRSPLARQRDRLEVQLGDQLTLRHDVEVRRLEAALARLDAFATRHPRFENMLITLENIYVVVAAALMGFVGVGLWIGKVGASHGQWPVLLFFMPFALIGMMIDVVPAYDSQARVKLIMLGLGAAFFVPLTIAIMWTVR